MFSTIWRRWLQRRARLRGNSPWQWPPPVFVGALLENSLLKRFVERLRRQPTAHQPSPAVAARPNNSIHWQMPIDLEPSGPEHYGEPIFTAANTVIVPMKPGSSGISRLEGIDGASGSVPVDGQQHVSRAAPVSLFTVPRRRTILEPHHYFTARRHGLLRHQPGHAGRAGSGARCLYGLANYRRMPRPTTARCSSTPRSPWTIR